MVQAKKETKIDINLNSAFKSQRNSFYKANAKNLKFEPPKTADLSKDLQSQKNLYAKYKLESNRDPNTK